MDLMPICSLGDADVFELVDLSERNKSAGFGAVSVVDLPEPLTVLIGVKQ